jgi:hypothetical protein
MNNNGNCAQKERMYILKRVIMSANDEANLMNILSQMNVRNGCLEVHKNNSNVCRISGFLR